MRWIPKGIGSASRLGTGRAREDHSGPGSFVNVHLPADDVERATAFYRELFGWEFRALPSAVPYMVTNPAQPEGPGIEAAIVKREPVVKAPTPTIEVQWIDDAMALIAMNQGEQSAVQDIPGIGRFGYARDCEGNTIALLQRNLLIRS
jgi:predicted enzyme related to lactoylglutathione lyase